MIRINGRMRRRARRTAAAAVSGLSLDQPSPGIPERMPDDDRRFFVPSPASERIDLASIKTDLEFAMDQLVRLYRQLARTALGIIFSTAVVTTLLNWWFLTR